MLFTTPNRTKEFFESNTDYFLELVKPYRLRDGFIHSRYFASSTMHIALISREANDHSLALKVVAAFILSDLRWCLIAVHDRHFTVHQYEFYAARFAIVICAWQVLIIRFLPILSDQQLYIVFTHCFILFEKLLDNESVHLIIIHYHDCKIHLDLAEWSVIFQRFDFTLIIWSWNKSHSKSVLTRSRSLKSPQSVKWAKFIFRRLFLVAGFSWRYNWYGPTRVVLRTLKLWGIHVFEFLIKVLIKLFGSSLHHILVLVTMFILE